MDLEPGTEVNLTIELRFQEQKGKTGEPYSFLRTAREIAREGLIKGPTDWSTRYEEYLYPDPPRSTRGDEE